MIDGWLVEHPDGKKSVWALRSSAEANAKAVGGECKPLFTAETMAGIADIQFQSEPTWRRTALDTEALWTRVDSGIE